MYGWRRRRRREEDQEERGRWWRVCGDVNAEVGFSGHFDLVVVEEEHIDHGFSFSN